MLEGGGELVGAGGRFAAASDALEDADDFGCLAAFDESRDALCVAVAAAGKRYLVDSVGCGIIVNVNHAGACAAGLVRVFHSTDVMMNLDAPRHGRVA